MDISKKLDLYESEYQAMDTPGEKYDENSTITRRSITINKKSYEYYPWGNDNKLPHKMMGLVRSNGDVANLLETRADFLYGSGIGLFENKSGKPEQLAFHADMTQHWLDHEMDDMTDAVMTNIVYTGQGYVNVSANKKKKTMQFFAKDPLTVRAIKCKEVEAQISAFALSSKWEDYFGKKNAVVVPAFDYNDPYAMETLVNLRKPMPGQFYYYNPQWWSLEEWIKVANRIAKLYNNSLDTEGNVGMILRVAGKLFEAAAAGHPVDENGKELNRQDLERIFKQTADKFLFGQDKNKILFDICGVNAAGEMEKWIEFEPVKKSLTGDEYMKLYQGALLAIANASGVLGGLSGVSDGKMNSGGGTEIRQTALYQQFYRTPRERKLIINFLNRVYLPYVKKKVVLPEGAYFDFKNIVLETLDQNKAGVRNVTTNAN